MSLHAGVVAVQGDVAEHADAVRRAGRAHGHDVSVEAVRSAGVVPECDLLLVPGGESTTISRLLHRGGIATEIQAHAAAGKPILATCAGLIVCSRDARDDRVDELGLIDVAVERNAFGRQRDSFEADLDVSGLEEPFHAVFIRAPAIEEVGDVEVLATVGDRPVAVRDGPVVGTAFHPELTDDPRLHGLALFEHAAADVEAGG